VKANRAQIGRALDQPDTAIRLILLHGPDTAASRELAGRLAIALGPDAERIDLTGSTLHADPARLPDEAAAIGLFGGARHILIDGAGDEITTAATTLLAAPSAGNPVVVIAGALRRDSSLLKLAQDSDQAIAFASYPPDGADADRLAASLAREAGVRLRPDLARRLAAQTGGDRALLRQEIAKFALYVDASPERPAELDVRAYDLLAVEGEDPGHAVLVDAALSGAALALDDALVRSGPADPIPLLRTLARRLLQLAELRARVEDGASIESTLAAAGRSLFWKDRDIVARELARLDAATLARAIERTAIIERQVKHNHPGAPIAADALLIDIVRSAARGH
jgi:DNA polymerase-3 subunit delta